MRQRVFIVLPTVVINIEFHIYVEDFEANLNEVKRE